MCASLPPTSPPSCLVTMPRNPNLQIALVDPLNGGDLAADAMPMAHPQHVVSPGPTGVDCWYPGGDNPGTSSVVASIGFIRCTPFVARRTGRIDAIGFFLTVNGGAGSVCRLGVYGSGLSSPFLPTNLLVGSAPIATDAGAGTLKSFSIGLDVDYGQLIWLTSIFGVAAPTITSKGVTSATAPYFYGYSATAVRQDSTFTAFAFAALPAIHPNPIGGFLADAADPWMVVRYSQ